MAQLIRIEGAAEAVERFRQLLEEGADQVVEVARFGTTLEVLVTGPADPIGIIRRPGAPDVRFSGGDMMPEHLFRLIRGQVELPGTAADVETWRAHALDLAAASARELGAKAVGTSGLESLDVTQRIETPDDGVPVGSILIAIMVPPLYERAGIVSVDRQGNIRARTREDSSC